MTKKHSPLLSWAHSPLDIQEFRAPCWWKTKEGKLRFDGQLFKGSDIFIRFMEKTGCLWKQKRKSGTLKKRSCQGVRSDSEIWFHLLLWCDSKCFLWLIAQIHYYPEAIPKSLAATYLPFWVFLLSPVDLLLLFHTDVWDHWGLPRLCVFPKRKKFFVDLKRFFKTP